MGDAEDLLRSRQAQEAARRNSQAEANSQHEVAELARSRGDLAKVAQTAMRELAMAGYPGGEMLGIRLPRPRGFGKRKVWTEDFAAWSIFDVQERGAESYFKRTYYLLSDGRLTSTGGSVVAFNLPPGYSAYEPSTFPGYADLPANLAGNLRLVTQAIEAIVALDKQTGLRTR